MFLVILEQEFDINSLVKELFTEKGRFYCTKYLQRSEEMPGFLLLFFQKRVDAPAGVFAHIHVIQI
jgi:hypothetical protein